MAKGEDMMQLFRQARSVVEGAKVRFDASARELKR